MNLVSLVIITALGLALGYFIVMLAIRIRNNMTVGESYRQALRTELSALRLERMLKALGIDHKRYLHQQNTQAIHQHMQYCRKCNNTDICDQQLCERLIDKDDIDFCSNAEALKAIITQQEKNGL